jgi:hypothetical protein
MAKTKERVTAPVVSVKPFVERALTDEKLRDDVTSAFATAKKVYEDLMGSKNVDKAAGKVLDKKLHKDLREAVQDLHDAALRLQGKKKSGGAARRIMIAGLALGILFNPVTGPETRRWLKDLVGGGSDDFGGDFGGTSGTTTGAGTSNGSTNGGGGSSS